MDETNKKLLDKFIEIRKMGWIKSHRNGTTGIGKTFEDLIEKDEESMETPDFFDIEIKTKRINSKTNMTLFNYSPYGNECNQIKYLVENFGRPCDNYNGKNVFFLNVNAKYLKRMGNYKFKLMIDSNNKIVLEIYDLENKLLDNSTFWLKDEVELKLMRKLQKLAVITADSKKNNNVEYFHYNKLRLYKLKSTEAFFELLKSGIVNITFSAGVYKNGEKQGQIDNHGTAFRIAIYDIEKLYEKIYSI